MTAATRDNRDFYLAQRRARGDVALRLCNRLERPRPETGAQGPFGALSGWAEALSPGPKAKI